MEELIDIWLESDSEISLEEFLEMHEDDITTIKLPNG